MIKQRRYAIESNQHHESRKLIYEETLNEKGLVISFYDYKLKIKGLMEYDAHNHLTSRLEIEDSGDRSQLVYTYNNEGLLTTELLYHDDILSCKVLYQYPDNGYEKRVFEFDEEVECTIETREGDQTISKYYEMGALKEKKISRTLDPLFKITVTYNDEDQLISTQEERYDNAGHLIQMEEKDATGKQVYLEVNEYQDGKIIVEYFHHHLDHVYLKTFYHYDEHKNLIREEMFTDDDPKTRLGHHINTYDEHQRLIRTKGFRSTLPLKHSPIKTTHFHEGYEFEALN